VDSRTGRILVSDVTTVPRLSQPAQDAADSRSLEDWNDLSKTAAGDEAAFGRIMARHQKRLFSLCYRLLQDAGDAEDAAQEVFLKLFGKAGSFEPRGQLFTLLYRMATNHCLNRLRRNKIAQFLPLQVSRGTDQGDVLEVEPPDLAPAPDERADKKQQWQAARAALKRLPSNQLAVVVLVRYEGLAYKEAAEVLGVSVGAVESRLFRAMRRLEKELAKGLSPGAGRKERS